VSYNLPAYLLSLIVNFMCYIHVICFFLSFTTELNFFKMIKSSKINAAVNMPSVLRIEVFSGQTLNC
jgi:hypothetical protein